MSLKLNYVETNSKIWTPNMGHLGSSFALERAGVRAGQVGKYQVISLEMRDFGVVVTFQTKNIAILPWAQIKVADGVNVEETAKNSEVPQTSTGPVLPG